MFEMQPEDRGAAFGSALRAVGLLAHQKAREAPAAILCFQHLFMGRRPFRQL